MSLKFTVDVCPCGSGKSYRECCALFHQGKIPLTVEELVRARYCAYVHNLPSYIIDTTHPGSPQYLSHYQQWSDRIHDFSSHTHFLKLEILGSKEWDKVGVVIFSVSLLQEGKESCFTERSFFEKKEGKWLYRTGVVVEGIQRGFKTPSATVLPLAYYGDPILRQKASLVEGVTEELRLFVQEMVETMDAYDGVGLAAPQVHRSIRLFVIRVPEDLPRGRKDVGQVKVFINPKLSKPTETMWKAEEGCLSIPTIHVEVRRPKEITVQYTDLEGNQREERVSGWEARAIMHETDHLNGVLTIDHLDHKGRGKVEPLLKKLESRIH